MTVHDHPTNGRLLTCVVCAGLVRVHEIPRPFLDPRRFTCGPCMQGDITLKTDGGISDETRRYDPRTAPMPEGY